MKNIELTTDKAMVFSFVMITVFTIVMIVTFFLFQSIPDTLVVAFFGAFGVEGGCCAFVHKTKTEKALKMMDKKEEDEENDGMVGAELV